MQAKTYSETRIVGYILGFLLLGACTTISSQTDQTRKPNPAQADAILAALAQRMVALQIRYVPTAAYLLGVPPSDNRRWPDRSPQALAAFDSEKTRLLVELKATDSHALSAPAIKVRQASMIEMLEADHQVRLCRPELWDVNHMSGWHLGLVDVAREQPVANARQRAEALERWSSLGKVVDQEIANARTGLAEGYSAPKPVVAKVIKQIDALISTPADRLPFYSPAERAEDAAFKQAFVAVLGGPVKAAFTRYGDFLRSEYFPRARESLGISAHPNGVECYQALLRSHTTLDRSPEAIFKLGQQAVAANSETVLQLGREKFGVDSLAAIVKNIPQAADNRFASEEEFIQYSQRVVERARRASAKLFVSLPRQEMRVAPFHPFQRGSGGSSYYEANLDAAKPAYYRINSEIWTTETRGGAEIAAAHEGYPGHHMQIAFANARNTDPIAKMTVNSAYEEGWARYAETLAEEAGIYRTDYALMTRRLWPARGMVADPGLHLYGWNREKIISYIRESGRFSGSEADDLVDRMAIWPGQLTAYDSGGLEIKALRAEAQQALGNRFDIRRFHQRVLENGAIPLRALRDHIHEWIAVEKAAR